MKVCKYAPLVYSRTLKVDYRWIVIPEGFTDAEKTWVDQYVTDARKCLPDKPSLIGAWLYFSSDMLAVFGLFCHSSVLGKHLEDEPGIPSIAKDGATSPRTIDRTFVGYVLKREEATNSFPLIQQNIEIFQQWARTIANQWEEKNAQDPKESPYKSAEELGLQERELDEQQLKSGLFINQDTEKVFCYPIQEAQSILDRIAQSLPKTSFFVLHDESSEIKAKLRDPSNFAFRNVAFGSAPPRIFSESGETPLSLETSLEHVQQEPITPESDRTEGMEMESEEKTSNLPVKDKSFSLLDLPHGIMRQLYESISRHDFEKLEKRLDRIEEGINQILQIMEQQNKSS